ncbi:oxygen-independent coproporphyrinogen-3 oxidase [Caloranaerobacter azorensis DSM 13643]|uniref:Heme chaperone HemW n=2 Tax=Caloranaerobacter azorensis TaxID=116090 RepID=A0A1M5V9T2_9FIRM|nr:oxygen-independent coproporphyrinogen-3 oxidase [Caloranaerobacter azorensis DSM 13643]
MNMYSIRQRSHHASLVKLKDAFTDRQNHIEYIKKVLKTKADRPRAIYIHIPYCVKLCSFCNLNRVKLDSSVEDYHKLIIRQIKSIADYEYIQSKEFESVYFGGGTPTVLSAKQIEAILKTMHDLLPISRDAEISVETSISELTEEKLDVMKEMGVNRFSIGVQTFVDRGRRQLGRRGSGYDAIKKIQKVIDKGFKNTNIDLIYNYPGQTKEELYFDLKIIKELDIAGISYYSLILHEGSMLSKLIKEGKIAEPPGIEEEKIFFDIIYEELLDSGFDVLEITKLVKKNRDKYQYIQVKNRAGDCLAFGNGAGGRLKNYLYYNQPTISKILYKILPVSPMGKVITNNYNVVDKMIGQVQFGYISFNQLDAETNEKMYQYCKDFIDRLLENGLIKKDGNKYKLTKDGIFWGNNICSDFTERLINFFEKYD